ncbi:hypothetical protein HGRIS_009144 [Hohenbuehelia grisea]|uniref:Bacteriophage T5 Orf172 DNA-binding domain-containing protein n=1 Tax=Hohenbuehelia grisea TaxID=104357 RepID=A0ABR3J080_9AGAR
MPLNHSQPRAAVRDSESDTRSVTPEPRALSSRLAPVYRSHEVQASIAAALLQLTTTRSRIQVLNEAILQEFDQAITVASQDRNSSHNEDPESACPTRSLALLCSGHTRHGAPCMNKVGPNGFSSAPGVRYCHQHATRAAEQNLASVECGISLDERLEKWLPKYLRPEAKKKLLKVMKEGPRPKEAPGYIYSIHYVDQGEQLQLKIGRTKDVRRRLRDWRKQCKTEMTLFGVHPLEEEINNNASLRSTSRPREVPRLGEPVRNSKLLERLVLLEMIDIASSQAHLMPTWPAVEGSALVSPLARPSQSDLQCPGCKKTHVEMFSIARFTEKASRGREWELIILPVIQRWERFISDEWPQRREERNA